MRKRSDSDRHYTPAVNDPTHAIAWGRGPLAPIVRGATEQRISTLSPYQAPRLREDEGETISTDNEV